MKFSKGIVKNINKKLIAGTLVMTLVMVPMSGCSEKYVDFEYSVNEQGEYEVSGTVDYKLLKDYEFIVIENTKYNTNEFYMCKVISHYNRAKISYYSYNNVFNNQEVFNERYDDGRKIVFSDNSIEAYLYATNNIKTNYTVEEVELIFEEFKENYLKENNKQLVKEK